MKKFSKGQKLVAFCALLTLLLFLGMNTAAGSEWKFFTPDSTGEGGTSLAVEEYGNAQVSYYDDENGNLAYVAAPENDWTKTTMDEEGDVGSVSSIALDSNRHPHIAYYDKTNGDLKYAYWDSDKFEWGTETVDSGGDVGTYPSIAIDGNDRPHIAYRNQSNISVKYAYWNGSSWNIEKVDRKARYISIDVDSDNHPHISYRDNDASALKHAYKGIFRGWEIETVDSGTYTGTFTSIAIDSGDNIHISYGSKYMDYAYSDGDSWSTSTVDSEEGVGYYSSIALDSDEDPHISYYDHTDEDLKYATWNSLTASWSTQTLESEGNVGEGTSIGLTTKDKVLISYLDSTDENLRIAESNTFPEAKFDYSPDSPEVNQTIEFNASESNDPDGSIEKYYWDFNDDNSFEYMSDSPEINYNYSESGTKSVTLKVEDDVGATDTIKKEIEVVDDSNTYPEANFTYSPDSPEVEEEITFDASDSNDPDGSIEKYYWDFDDDNNFEHTSDSPEITHSYSESGTKDVTLKVEDDAGDSFKYTALVEVVESTEENNAPVLTDGSVSPTVEKWGEKFVFQADYQDDDGDAPVPSVRVFIDGNGYEMTKVSGTYEGGATYEYEWTPGSEEIGSHTYKFTAYDGTDTAELPEGGSFSDLEVEQHPPEADFQFTVDNLFTSFNDQSTDEENSIVSWEWDFDDDGVIDSTEENPTHTFPSPGTYEVSVKVTDSYESSDEKTREITVGEGNKVPIADFSYVKDGLSVDFMDESFDPDGVDDLSSWSWDFGDGSSSSEENPTHVFDSTGTYTVELTVEDSEGAEDTVSIDVTVQEGFDVNLKPNLISGSVTPSSGSVGDKFTFEVNYEDPEDQEPDFIGVYIDGAYHEMEKEGEGSFDEGVIYQYEWEPLSLHTGSHEFYFTASDGKNSVRDPVKGNYSGPDVEPEESTGEETLEISANSRGEGSVNIEPSKESYEQGEEVTLTAEPDPGYEFAGWSGDISGDSKSISRSVDSDMNVYALFQETDEAEKEESTEQAGEGEGPEEGMELPLEEIAITVILLALLAAVVAIVLYKKKEIFKKKDE